LRLAIAALSFLVLVDSANAGSSSGIVAVIYAHEGDVVMFVACSHQGRPACSTIGNDWAISLATPTGKAMYAMLLSAQAQGKPVNVVGTDTCSAYGDREAPRYISVLP
jgi:hypothetical protein